MMKKQCPHHFKGEMLPFLEVCGTQIVKNRLKPGFGQMDHISTNFLTRLIFIQFIYHSSWQESREKWPTQKKIKVLFSSVAYLASNHSV